MKYLLLPVLLLIVSCNRSQDHSHAPTGRKIDPLLMEVLNQYPQYKTNGIQREELVVALDRFVDSILNKGYFDDLPVELRSVEKSAVSNKAVFHFQLDELGYGSAFISDRLKYDLYGHIDDSVGKTLSEGSKYYIFSRNYSRMDKSKKNQKEPITFLSSFGNDYDFELGSFEVGAIDSVKSAPRNNE